MSFVSFDADTLTKDSTLHGSLDTEPISWLWSADPHFLHRAQPCLEQLGRSDAQQTLSGRVRAHDVPVELAAVLHKLYVEVQLNYTTEIEVFCMLFERCHTKNRKISQTAYSIQCILNAV